MVRARLANEEPPARGRDGGPEWQAPHHIVDAERKDFDRVVIGDRNSQFSRLESQFGRAGDFRGGDSAPTADNFPRLLVILVGQEGCQSVYKRREGGNRWLRSIDRHSTAPPVRKWKTINPVLYRVTVARSMCRSSDRPAAQSRHFGDWADIGSATSTRHSPISRDRRNLRGQGRTR